MSSHRRILGFRAGDTVEVRTPEEILSTLDEHGQLDGLPFMPEMLQYCGKRFTVYRRADKTCDTVKTYQSRRMRDAVHLEGLRCDGAHHGGCQAACLLFWKEAWLRRASEGVSLATRPLVVAFEAIDLPALEARTTRPDPVASGERLYVCQATALPRATTPLGWWDPRQYIRELRSGNVRFGTLVRVLARSWYGALYRRFRDRRYPYVAGPLVGPTPSRQLALRPGERVRVRSRDEIHATLNTDRKNRGLTFDVEMVSFCGREFQVLGRVSRIINDRTGKMIQLPGDCIVLDGVVCEGHLSRNRLFCPRSIYPYWREIWLERI